MQTGIARPPGPTAAAAEVAASQVRLLSSLALLLVCASSHLPFLSACLLLPVSISITAVTVSPGGSNPRRHPLAPLHGRWRDDVQHAPPRVPSPSPCPCSFALPFPVANRIEPVPLRFRTPLIYILWLLGILIIDVDIQCVAGEDEWCRARAACYGWEQGVWAEIGGVAAGGDCRFDTRGALSCGEDCGEGWGLETSGGNAARRQGVQDEVRVWAVGRGHDNDDGRDWRGDEKAGKKERKGVVFDQGQAVLLVYT